MNKELSHHRVPQHDMSLFLASENCRNSSHQGIDLAIKNILSRNLQRLLVKLCQFHSRVLQIFFGGPRATPTREYFIPQCIRRECTSHALTWWTDSSLSLASLTVISCRKAWNRDLHKNKKRQNERIASSLICTTRVNCCYKVTMASQKF